MNLRVQTEYSHANKHEECHACHDMVTMVIANEIEERGTMQAHWSSKACDRVGHGVPAEEHSQVAASQTGVVATLSISR